MAALMPGESASSMSAGPVMWVWTLLEQRADAEAQQSRSIRARHELHVGNPEDWLALTHGGKGHRCRIGPFVLDAGGGLLLLDEVPLQLGRRAVAVLAVLVEKAGAVVSKDELLERAWGGVLVEESNLATQILALRRALAKAPAGDGWVETLPRRGYRFVGPVQWVAPPAPADPASSWRDRPSLAVLPFRTPPPCPVPQHIADGLVAEVISAMSQLGDLAVISLGSTMRMRGSELLLSEVGQQLGARYIVSGSMWQKGGRTRVLSEVAEAANGHVLSSRAYDAEPGSTFEAQEEMAARIVRMLAPRVKDEELRRVQMKRPEDYGAYDLVLQARDLIYRLEQPAFVRAEGLLRQAVEMAPRYSVAYRLLAELHSLRLGQGWSEDRAADAAAVERFSLAAVERDPDDPRAMARYGHTRSLLHRDYDMATKMFERALERDPNNAEAWMWSSVTQSFLGHGETAVEQATRALRLSPRDWHGYRFHSALCLAHYTAGDGAAASRAGLMCLSENPRDMSNMRYTVASLVCAGEMAQARELADRVMMLEPTCRVGPIVERHPYSEPARRRLYGEHLLAAGLPD